MSAADMAVAVPPSFLCPISLEVMKDPVTLSTGHTYDRANIEKWLRTGHNTCPVTMTPLRDDTLLIPNLIVRRLIRAWIADHECKRAFNSASSFFSVRDCVLSLISEIAKSRRSVVAPSVKALRHIAIESKDIRSFIVNAGAPILLVSLLCPDAAILHDCDEACEDALSILALLCRSSYETRAMVAEQEKLPWVVWHLRVGSSGAKGRRVAAAELIGAVLKRGEGSEAAEAVSRERGVVEGLVSLLKEVVEEEEEGGGSGEVAAAAAAERRRRGVLVKALERACRLNRQSRERAIEEGGVGALVSLMVRCHNRACTEKAAAALELLCFTEQGKNAASKLPAFFPALIDRILLRVSPACTEHAASCILHVCSLNSAHNLRIALSAGIYPRLLLLLQSNSTSLAKSTALQLLKRLHHAFGFLDAPFIQIHA